MSVYISGLLSGLDWQSIISQLMEVEHRPIDLLETQKESINARYSAWTDVNSKLLSLKTTASSLTDLDDFNLYTSTSSVSGTTKSVDELMGFTIGSNASPGSYTIEIDTLAQAQKLGSRSFGSMTEALGFQGEVVINGRTVSIDSTDSLADIRTAINALNSGNNPAGVTASIFTAADGEYRLTLTSLENGAEGIEIYNASSTDVLGFLGLTDTSTSLAHAITNGAQSSLFTDSSEAISTVLNLSSASSGTVTIAGQAVDIDFATDSLQAIRDKIDALTGVSATIVSTTEGDDTTYILQIDGTQDFTDNSNILQTLGFLKQGHSDVLGVRSDTANTVNGSTITEDTLLVDIDGYNSWTSGDSITISGTDHDGGAVSSSYSITQTSTLGDLLTAIETAYGTGVSAYIDATGALVVEDNEVGESNLTLALDVSGIANADFDFGTFSSETVRKREIVSGTDSQITIDGVTITRSTNQIDDVIPGVTMSIVGEDEGAVVTLNIDRDYDGIKSKISEFVDAYNEVIAYINEQFEYSDDSEETNPLFGDASLMGVRSSIRSAILSEVDWLDSDLDHLSLIGITIDRNGVLSIDHSTLDGYLRSNFNDVVNLFVAQGASTNSNLRYLISDENTLTGSYEVEITQAATQASTTGFGFSGTLSSDATITITDDQSTEAVISLTAGWTISAIVNAINASLSEESMGVRAVNDNGELKIYNTSYGDESFTISVSGGNLGIADSTYTGTDVAGRIRAAGSETWMTMTGNGRNLTGDDDQDVEGLVLNYSGTTTGVFDFTFTTGIAEKLDRVLYSMTDPLEGYVAGKKDSLTNQINKIDRKIEDMEKRLEKREEILMNQYIAMESMLSQLQAQQQWLESQIEGLTANWA
ncbi:MAG: flagellar filament capping protein FliD [Desulfomonilia bacterium]